MKGLTSEAGRADAPIKMGTNRNDERRDPLGTTGEVARIIREKGDVVAFTGAGISVDAGIPAFRGGQGLWEKYDPMEYAQIDAFLRHPGKVWAMLRARPSLSSV